MNEPTKAFESWINLRHPGPRIDYQEAFLAGWTHCFAGKYVTALQARIDAITEELEEYKLLCGTHEDKS